MTIEQDVGGLGTRNIYGIRDTNEGLEGKVKTSGNRQQIDLVVSGKAINDDVYASNLAFLPAGALIVAAYAEVTEAFDLGGTTPTIDIGTDGSEATNNVAVDEASAEALGTYDIFSTAAGTWAASLAADTEVSVALGGSTPTATDGGLMRVVIEYIKS
jgi:hypothetical protein